ncbi:MAG: extracellular solute-binding protein [Erysipelotrichaceae bacterium]|nr:extracellular solute-binding protein [Erysipelotrichaceae bacterium]
MKKLIIILLITGLLSGCQKAGSGDNNKTNAGKTVITITTTYDLTEFEKGLEAKYSNIDLKVEVMATGTINGEITRRLRNNHGSDLIVTNLPYGEIKDYTYNLSAESFVENYQSAITKSIVVDGENRYLALPGTYYGYIVNKTLLDELNLSLPETTNDILNIFKVAKEKEVGVSKETGAVFGLSDVGASFFGAYFTADYATDYLTNSDGAKWLFDFENKEATFKGSWEHSIDFIKECIDKGYLDANKLIVFYNGRLEESVNSFKAEENIPNRTAIMTYGNLEMLKQIEEKTDDEIVMVPCLPRSSDGNKLLSSVSNNFIAINKSLENDKTKLNAALSVLDYLSSEEGQAKWIEDSVCPHSFINGYKIDLNTIPDSIREYVNSETVFTNPFPTNLLSYIGKNLIGAAKGQLELDRALELIDDYYRLGSDEIEYDLSVVGTVAADMLYENYNTRKMETEIGNLIADAVKEMADADVALVNGGAIRSSIYKGDVTGEDLSYASPYNNMVVVAEISGSALKEAITNGIQKTWKPAGQFLQVAGIKYSYKPANNENETAELVSITYADGSEIKDDDLIAVAYTDYMGGKSGYIDAGDGYTMLNVLDENSPITAKLITNTNKTFRDALKEYFENHKDEEIKAQLEGRITIVE